MSTDRPHLTCPTCGRPHPMLAGATDPHYCSIACYRAAHHLDDTVTADRRQWCPGCSRYLDNTTRRWCSAACRVADWRRRQPAPASPSSARPATHIAAVDLAAATSQHAPAPYTSDDSATVVDDAVASLGILRRLQFVGDAGAVLHLLASLTAETSARLPQAIADARHQNYPWSEIAALTGLSRDRVQRLANHRRTPPDDD